MTEHLHDDAEGEDAARHPTAQLRRRVFEPDAQLAAAAPTLSLAAVFDDMFEGIQLLDADFRYVYLNAAAASHGRRPREELIGQRMADMYPGIEQTDVFALMRRCMIEHTPQQMINRFAYPDGRSAWFDLRITPVPMGILVLSVDISAQKSVEERLRQSQENLAITLECMTEGVITTDVDERITRMNPAAEALTGWPENEAKGHPFDELVQFLDRRTNVAIEHPTAQVLRQGGALRLTADAVLVARHGRHLPVTSSGAPIRDAGGAVRGVVLVIRDMTEEHKLTAMLNQAQKMEAIGRLAGSVAHDFNNLLTVISGYVTLALGSVAKDDALWEPLEEIRQAGERATALTRQLLAFSRKQVLHPTVVDLNTIVEQMHKMLLRLLGEDVDLVTKLTPSLHPVLCDPDQVAQIVMNLAVNARDAMPGGGKLTIETANVTLDDEYVRTHPAARPGPHVMIAVTDTGTGMDAETQARLFEPFFTTKEQGKGTGLGLATVYGIVKQSGGNIWVYSEPGYGTTFKIYFPQAAEGALPIPPPAPQHAATRGTGTILVVEDDARVRTLIQRILETDGYTVLATSGADDALALCREYDGEIHVLLTDVVLERTDGRELSRQALAIRPNLKVIFMSGYTDTVVVRHGVLDPGVAFIEKPITPGLLLEKLRKYLA